MALHCCVLSLSFQIQNLTVTVNDKLTIIIGLAVFVAVSEAHFRYRSY